ncbi:uncharacterized protein LOC132563432 [Ylistrum balloti]|uniref:uncharacterized protein LOC132563432 n=1 Tax=Ylistrum balloti TaxID=509963 RepID=UPI002905B638|nr:uncharacterized protein LOC132563432 [Ylistrum balloti]
MLAVVCLLAVLCSTYAESATASYFDSADHCKPICPCLMDGIYHDHGDEWTQKDKPCVRYKCEDGFYQPIYQGCDYKGQCKDANSTWTEKCMTYRCTNFETYNDYTLIEGGCRAQGECKKLSSFWHDGCSMFQCVEKDDEPLFYMLTDELMYWPTGNYSLLETVGGCPVDVKEEWKTGSRFHMGDGQNFVSTPFNLHGNYTKKFFEHRFCSHVGMSDTTLIPRYQTYWDPGRYCIMRLNGNCPEGFHEGYVEMDDLNGFELLNYVNGTVPDGKYKTNTGFDFCCRTDGDIDTPIILPKELPFALFMASEADDCQTVRGMTYKKEFFVFDDENVDVNLKKTGSTPEIKDCDNNTMMYFCFYTPLDCGCKDNDGNFIKTGSKLTTGCVTYECKEIQNIEYLEVFEGGCSVGDICKKENETWIETQGEKCNQKICHRDLDERGQTIFVVKSIKLGCQDAELCRDLGYKKARGCYVSECRLHPTTYMPYFYLQKAGCSDGTGGCIPIGTTYTKDCITYRCRRQTSRCGNEFVKGACKYYGECKDPFMAFKGHGCNILQCMMEKNGTSIRLYVKTFLSMCSYNNQCYKIGQTVQDGCFLRRCMAGTNGYACHMGLDTGACAMGDGTCLNVGDTYEDRRRCVTYYCKQEQRGSSYTFSKTIQKMGCLFRGTCVPEGSFQNNSCSEYVCSVKKTPDNRYSAAMNPYKRACRDYKGNCLAIGESIEENCSTYTCDDNNPSHTPVLKFVAQKCKDNNRVCRSIGTEWNDDKRCMVLKCDSYKLPNGKHGLQITPSKMGCMYRGICRQSGEEWAAGNCLVRKCLVSSSNGRYSRSIQTKAAGCKDPSTGLCRKPGEEWKHAFRNGCAMLVCVTCERGGYKPSVAQYLCKDASGKCRHIGDKGFTVSYRNRYYSGCQCKASGIHARVSCGGRK